MNLAKKARDQRMLTILCILRVSPKPLMSAIDIASELNKFGRQVTSTNMAGTLAGMRQRGMVLKRTIPRGIFELDAMRWAQHNRRQGGYWPKRAYWLASDRLEEVYPLGTDGLMKRDKRR
jgi:hypothetical protein